jgi:hypothetical protein
MSFSGIVQFILGVIVGVAILGMSGLAAGTYFFNRLSTVPDRPVFPEESAGSEPVATENTPPAAEPTPEPEPEPEPKIELEPGAYLVRVTWPDGLILRDEPSLEAGTLGSVLYDQKMVVLSSTDDGLWDRVRIPDTDEVGWVKAGNAERIELED